ncbi:MAG: ABC transporter permease [Prevotellaceae bacterium]|jgi:ABC-2 type transport system permease protein|nr:ABC transporter permease [Prevotellaceae bacterium]
MTLKYLLEKEFKQFFRNKFMPKIVIIFPLMVILVMPWAATLDIKHIKVSIIDNDLSPLSTLLTQKVGNSTYFDLTSIANNYEQAMEHLEYGRADLILEIPSGFESDLINFRVSPIQVSVNAVNSIKGMMGQSYITSLVSEFSQEQLLLKKTNNNQVVAPKVDIIVKNMYNPTLDYKYTMIPGLMMVIMVVLCAFLPAVNIVQEKEIGTIEQLNVTPIRKFTFILAKLIPFWIIGLTALTLAFVLSWLVYGLTPVGSFGTIYLFSGLFILTMTGAGLVVSNHSTTMQQATFVMFFFVIISILLCGLLTPVDSMPNWAQVIAGLTPTKYIVNVLRCVYLKGNGVANLWVDLLALSIMAITFNVWAVLSYKKSK